MNIIQTIIFWVSVITVHELGHIVAWMILEKNKPSITFKWWGGIIIGEKQAHLQTIKNSWIVLFTGVVIGAIPFWLTITPDAWLLLYLLMSMFDITQIIQIMTLPSWQWRNNWRIISVNKYEIRRLVRTTWQKR